MPFAHGLAAVIANKSNHNDQHQRYHSVRSYTRRDCASGSTRKLYVRSDISVPFPSSTRTNNSMIIELSASLLNDLLTPSHNAIPFLNFFRIRATKRRIVADRTTHDYLNPSLYFASFGRVPTRTNINSFCNKKQLDDEDRVQANDFIENIFTVTIKPTFLIF